MYQKYLEPIIDEFTTGDYYREVFQAKQEYFEKVGVVHEDDPEFEQRMSCFMDWYLFDRDLPGIDLPPVKTYHRKNQARFTKEENEIHKDLCQTNHSVYRLKRFGFLKKGLVLLDLFSNKTFHVVDSEVNTGFSRGDIFEARLIPIQGKFEFSRGFCFHAHEMESFILSEIRKIRFQDKRRQTKLIFELSAMKLKHLRFPHIDVKHIYTFDSKF